MRSHKGINMRKTVFIKALCAVLVAFMLLLPLASCSAGGRDFTLKTRTLTDEQRYGTDVGYKKYNDGSVIIVDHNGKGDVEIPDEIDGMSVVELADSLFEGREDITSVKLPDSLEIIGDAAFNNCKALANVEIGDKLWSVGADAFGGTPWLASFTDEFSVVGNGVLIKYNGLATGISIPEDVSHIAGGVFAKREIRSVDLGSVLTVGNKAFLACSNMIRVDCGDSLVLIGEGAFENCTLLEEIVLPNSLTDVRSRAFADCSELALAVYYGKEAEFGNISFGEENRMLSEAALVIYRGGTEQ